MNSADEGYSEAPLNSSASSFYKSLADDTSTSSVSHLILRHMAKLSIAKKAELTLALLDDLPTSVVADIVQRLNPRLYIDFVMYLPAEICLKIMGYLDPLSLINLAKVCRAWHNLASDRKLWERIFYREGWRTIKSEIDLWEEKVNAAVLTGSLLNGPLHRLRSSEDGHTHKKRAIASPTKSTYEDTYRADRRSSAGPDPDRDVAMSGSIFGGGGAGSASDKTCVTPALDALDMNGHPGDPKGKGKELATSLSRETSDIKPESLPDIIPAQTNLPRTTLWNWHSNSNKYKLNWKYMCATRHKLEKNWERGKYVNFQFPHPDHMEEGHKDCIYSFQFNSEYLVSGSRDKTARIWSMHTRRLLRPPLVGHRGSVLCLQFDSSPEEDIIVTGSSDSDVIIWRFSTGEVLQRLSSAHHESVLNVKFDKKILVTCSKDKTIKIFNRKPMVPGDVGYGESGGVYQVGRTVAQHSIQFDGVDNLPIKPPYSIIGALTGHGAAVNAVQICGNEIVSASGDRNIKIWDWPSRQCKRTYIGHSKGIACVQYDGKRIVSGSNDNQVKVFDSRTGLEVASLSGHTDLVRTVQAGFADLPYSDFEDAEEAKRLDRDFSAAVTAGNVSNGMAQSMGARTRSTGNGAGGRSRDHTAFGAKLPPGGGGGKYARIVSGSYDESIIIWRRNQDGVWYEQHHLKQEDAAAAAAVATVPTGSSRELLDGSLRGRTPDGVQAQPGDINGLSSAEAALLRLRAQRQPDSSFSAGTGAPDGSAGGPSIALSRTGSTLSHLRAMRLEGLSTTQTQARAGPSEPSEESTLSPTRPGDSAVPVEEAETQPLGTGGNSSMGSHAALTQASARSLAQMIELTVPQGVYDLQQALSNFPAMLALEQQLQEAIDREPNPMVRSQMRQAVSTAGVRAQLAQARAQRESLQSLRVAGSAGRAAEVAAAAAAANLGGTSGSGRPQPASSNSAPTILPSSGRAGEISGLPPSMDAVALATLASGGTGGPPPAPTGVPPPAPTAAHAQPVQQEGWQDRHPHPMEDRPPVRVFKLQFDARRIICCSQTSVIVGWDFCNGDPELEEASRFWAAVE